MALATLRISFEGTVREEVVDLRGTSPHSMMQSAKSYMETVNVGFSWPKWHVLLSVKPLKSLGAGDRSQIPRFR